MLEWQKKNKRIHEQKENDFYIYEKENDERDLNQSVSSIKDVKIYNCS